jgi:hypothetical protein
VVVVISHLLCFLVTGVIVIISKELNWIIIICNSMLFTSKSIDVRSG